MINCIAIDDNTYALEIIKEFLEKLPGYSLINSYTDPLTALNEISGNRPVDLIFMDVEMPLLNGVDLAGMIRHKTRSLIFTTSHPQYAIDAFKVNAEAYLLKPFSLSKFITTLQRVSSDAEGVNNDLAAESSEFYIAEFSNPENLIRVNIEDLRYIQKESSKVIVQTLSHRYEVGLADFKVIMQRFKHHKDFIAVNPNCLVSKHHLTKIHGKVMLFEGDIKLTVQGNYLTAFKDYLLGNSLKAKVVRSKLA